MKKKKPIQIKFRKRDIGQVKRGDVFATIYFGKILNKEIEKRFYTAVKLSTNAIKKPKVILG